MVMIRVPAQIYTINFWTFSGLFLDLTTKFLDHSVTLTGFPRILKYLNLAPQAKIFEKMGLLNENIAPQAKNFLESRLYMNKERAAGENFRYCRNCMERYARPS